jgi:hypothetical protein
MKKRREKEQEGKEGKQEGNWKQRGMEERIIDWISLVQIQELNR